MDLFDLADWLEDASKDVKKEIEQEVHKGAKQIQAYAKGLCPVDTGYLRNSISTDVHWQGNTCIGIIGTNVEYAPYVEYGTGIYSSLGTGRQTPWLFPLGDGTFRWTKGQMPQAFMTPALDNNADYVFRNIMDMIGRLLN